VAFFDTPDAENKVAFSFGTLKHRFIGFENSRFLRRPEGRL
jgi:hypothetical protein